ncbi:MAG: alpha-isopropylmalate synthase regulatory domain-containing protein, partial [Candidatus Micrarchaeia archaeon]
LEEIAVALKDMFGIEKIKEKNIFKVSKLVEMFSGKRISFNKPIVGENAFVQTAGIHADGDIKGNLYKSKLTPERFGRKTEYALGKLSGKASLEQNLKELGIELSEKAKKKLLERIVELGDKKRSVTTEDLPFLIEDLIESPEERRFEILDLAITTGKGIIPTASYRIKCGKKELKITGFGDGGYDAFMNGLKKNEKRIGIKLPELIDYNVRIPPGGKTDAVVETTITWKIGNEIFRTIGVDCDQVMAAIKATEKMLNFLSFKSKSKKK